jgi:hypothetical protein
MGCPIRSEIWACVAPGAPRVAVRYAYEDAICDHAGGESVYGEMFNTAIEAAAFVVSDSETLLDIGRSYVPDGSQTAKAIDAARQAYRDGVDWREARKRVLEATPSHNAQYSPINMAFQVIGLLYGADFGDAICIAVNCGYDTDCTGATIGSWLGIVAGAAGLPAKWTEPLGDVIATNESWGGLLHASTDINPVPTNLTDLTTRTIVQAKRTVAAQGAGAPTSLDDLYADDAVRALWTAPASGVLTRGVIVDTLVDYLESPSIEPGVAKKIVTRFANRGAATLNGSASLTVPDGWTVSPDGATVEIGAHGTSEIAWTVAAPTSAVLGIRNDLSVGLSLTRRSVEQPVPAVLVGARALQVAGPFPLDGGLDVPTPAETAGDDLFAANGRAGQWTTVYAHENALPVAPDTVGAVYVRAFLYTPEARMVRVGVPATVPTKVWVNNVARHTVDRCRILRPNYGGDDWSYFCPDLAEGWNEVLMKFVRTPDDPPLVAHLTLSESNRLVAGLIDVGWTRLPWEV